MAYTDIKRGYETVFSSEYTDVDWMNPPDSWFIYDPYYNLVASNSSPAGWLVSMVWDGWSQYASLYVTPPVDATIANDYSVPYVSSDQNMYGEYYSYVAGFNVTCGLPAVPPTPIADSINATTSSVRMSRNDPDSECGYYFTYEYKLVSDSEYTDSVVASYQYSAADINGLLAGKSYHIRIRASNYDNTLHSYGEPIVANTLCEAPTNFIATPIKGYKAVRFDWDASEGATKYLIQRSDTWGYLIDYYTTGDANELSYVDSLLTYATTITYRVYAINADDIVSAAYGEVYAYSPPAPPSNFHAESVGNDIVLTWIDDINAAYADMEYSVDGGITWGYIYGYGQAFYATYTFPTPGTGKYMFRIRSLNYTYGYGEWSTPISIDFKAITGNEIRQGDVTTGYNLALVNNGVVNTAGLAGDWEVWDDNATLVDSLVNGAGNTLWTLNSVIYEDGTNIYLTFNIPTDTPSGLYNIYYTGSSNIVYHVLLTIVERTSSTRQDLTIELSAKLIYKNDTYLRIFFNVDVYGGNNNVTYLWTYGGAGISASGPTVYLEIPVNTTETVTVTVTDFDNNFDAKAFSVSASFTVAVDVTNYYISGGQYFYRLSITPSGGSNPYNLLIRTPFQLSTEPIVTLPDAGLYRASIEVIDSSGYSVLEFIDLQTTGETLGSAPTAQVMTSLMMAGD